MEEQEKEILEEELEQGAEDADQTSEAEADSDADMEVDASEDVDSEEADGDEDAVDDDAQDALAGDDDGTPEGTPKTWAEKKAAKKQAKQDKKADAAKEKIAELEDRVKRQMAEFDNFRKRTEKEKTAMFETGAASVLEKILPVIDNFERGLATVPEDKKDDAFVDGMNKVYRQMLDELDKIGVKAIESVGQEFDPNLHNAVMQVESEEFESGIVAQELQKGYIYHDKVIRHSMVAVVS